MGSGNKQLRHALSSMEYAALLRAWKNDFGISSPCGSPRAGEADGSPARLKTPEAYREPPAGYCRGYLGIGGQSTTYPETPNRLDMTKLERYPEFDGTLLNTEERSD